MTKKLYFVCLALFLTAFALPALALECDDGYGDPFIDAETVMANSNYSYYGDCLVEAGYAYQPTQQGMVVFNVSDPENPIETGSVSFGGDSHSIRRAAFGSPIGPMTHVLLPRGWEGLKIVTDNPVSPTVVATIPGYITSADYYYGHLIVANSNNDSVELYVRNGSTYNFTLQSSVAFSSPVRDICMADPGRALVITDEEVRLVYFWDYDVNSQPVYSTTPYLGDLEVLPPDAIGGAVAFKPYQPGYIGTTGTIFFGCRVSGVNTGYWQAWHYRLSSFHSYLGGGGGDVRNMRVQGDYMTIASRDIYVNEQALEVWNIANVPYDGYPEFVATTETASHLTYGGSYDPSTNWIFAADWSGGYEAYHLTCPTIDPIQDSILYQILPLAQYLYQHSFSWETTGLSDPALDKLTISVSSGFTPCVPTGVYTNSTVVQQPSGRYLHTIKFNTNDCLTRCRFQYTVTSGLNGEFFTSDPKVHSQKYCPQIAFPYKTVPGLDTRARIESVAPNPFNPMTTISCYVPEGARNAALTIYNQRGQKVRDLRLDAGTSGLQDVLWNGTDNSGSRVASNVYFAVLVIDDVKTIQKMALLK